MTDRSFEQANDESRERLAGLVATLTPSQLEMDLGEGWTVASALAHAGFWDRWQAERWSQVLEGTWTADDDTILAAEHLANEALHPYWAGASAQDIPALALEAAARLDALIARAPDDVVDSIEGTPISFLLHRHRHRGDHLDHIERTIAAGIGSAPDRSFVEKNAASRRRLTDLVGRLTPADLALATAPSDEGGWTVAQTLGHLAFWDRSMETRWRMALETAGPDGRLEPVGVPQGMTEAINRPLAYLLEAWTGQLGVDVGAQAVAAAESLDSLLSEVADRMTPGLQTMRPSTVNRWIHRDGHLDAVEAAVEGRNRRS